MELEDLVFLGACQLLSGTVSENMDGSVTVPTKEEINAALDCAQEIWERIVKEV